MSSGPVLRDRNQRFCSHCNQFLKPSTYLEHISLFWDAKQYAWRQTTDPRLPRRPVVSILSDDLKRALGHKYVDPESLFVHLPPASAKPLSGLTGTFNTTTLFLTLPIDARLPIEEKGVLNEGDAPAAGAFEDAAEAVPPPDDEEWREEEASRYSMADFLALKSALFAVRRTCRTMKTQVKTVRTAATTTRQLMMHLHMAKRDLCTVRENLMRTLLVYAVWEGVISDLLCRGS